MGLCRSGQTSVLLVPTYEGHGICRSAASAPTSLRAKATTAQALDFQDELTSGERCNLVLSSSTTGAQAASSTKASRKKLACEAVQKGASCKQGFHVFFNQFHAQSLIQMGACPHLGGQLRPGSCD